MASFIRTVDGRLRAVLLVLVLLAGAVAGTTAFSPVAAHAATTAAHPYSDPVWYPVHATSRIDCVHNNPGCKNPRSYWAMSIVPDGQYGVGARQSYAGVFSMGAGIVHYGNTHGTACGHGSNFGTWVYIDHGAGVFSRYGHFSRISVANGARVAAGQQIGVVGTTGKGSNCSLSYTTVMVDHYGLADTRSVQVKTLLACVGSARTATTWPSGFNSHWATWNTVPQNNGNYPHPSFPANSSTCIKNPAAATAAAPKSTTVARAGSGRILVRWTRPAAASRVNSVVIEVSKLHSGSTWDSADQQTHYAASPSASSHEFTGLLAHHEYRIRVSFHNPYGWSLNGGWRTITTS